MFKQKSFSARVCLVPAAAAVMLFAVLKVPAADRIRQLQTEAINRGNSPVGHWGTDPEKYREWSSHSNRLIPVYTYGTRGAGAGVDLTSYSGESSLYRSEEKVRQLYGRLPTHTVAEKAEYLDQTDLYRLQAAAAKAGKKHIFLVVFDGMDWQTTQAAAIAGTGVVVYREGRGHGLDFQHYMQREKARSQYGWMVTSPHNQGTKVDVNTQMVSNPGGVIPGGYDPERGGWMPWQQGVDLGYLISRTTENQAAHAFTDSASSATSMTSGIKTYNGAINVDASGAPVSTIAVQLQAEGWATGAVTSVPISHATPASTAAHNVHRSDYQDLTRDLLGLKSVSHPEAPLPGLDVLIGAGYGVNSKADRKQGENFVPGNRYLAEEDLKQLPIENGGRYVVAQRTAGVDGGKALQAAAERAATGGHRLFGFYGVSKGHLPFQTWNGDYQPAPGRAKAEKYTEADLEENPTLAEMTSAALTVLSRNDQRFWLLVESGDVDWANHDNNLDNSIGAVLSGDAAVRVVIDWVEQHSNWDESLMIVTADHGHLLVLRKPEELIRERD